MKLNLSKTLLLSQILFISSCSPALVNIPKVEVPDCPEVKKCVVYLPPLSKDIYIDAKSGEANDAGRELLMNYVAAQKKAADCQ